MGKITVKHYLNTDVKEGRFGAYVFKKDGFELSESDTMYPVYLLITYNRKTTKLRSYTNKTLLKEEFVYYKKHQTYIGEKKQNNYNSDKYLSNELEKVEISLDYFYNHRKGEQNSYSIKTVLDFYMSEFSSSYFISKINSDTIFEITNPTYSFVHTILKPDAPTINLIDFFTETLQVDIFKELETEIQNLLKGAQLFFYHLPKDKEGKSIGRLIDWYKDDILKNSFKDYIINSKKSDVNYYNAFFDFMHYLEKYRMKRPK